MVCVARTVHGNTPDGIFIRDGLAALGRNARRKSQSDRCSYGLSSVQRAFLWSHFWATWEWFGPCCWIADKTGKGHSRWRASSYEVTPSGSDLTGDGRRIVRRPAMDAAADSWVRPSPEIGGR